MFKTKQKKHTHNKTKAKAIISIFLYFINVVVVVVVTRISKTIKKNIRFYFAFKSAIFVCYSYAHSFLIN